MINQVRQSFNNNFKTAVESSYNKFILSGQVGLGKTEVLRNINKFTSESAVICFPTHELKEEFIKSKKFSDCLTTPTPPSSLSNYVSFLMENESNNVSSKIKSKFSDFYSSLNSIIEFPGTIITTHDAFLCSHFKFKQKLIIFDEIPTNLFGQLHSESIFALQELLFINAANESIYQKDLDCFLRELQNQIEQQNPFATNDNIIQLVQSNISSVLKLFISKIQDKHKITKLFKNINSVLKQKELFVNYSNNTITSHQQFPFADDKKYVCFSATPDVELFSVYGFKHLQTEQLECQAEVIHVPINTSRVALSNKENREDINKLIVKNKIPKVISYKDVLLKNKVPDVYFGNAEGTNKYEKEEVIGIIGTPFYGSSYLQTQCILHHKLNFTEHDFVQVDKEIMINNQKVLFRTFQNNWLTNQHLFQIESALIQVIGRLRPFTRQSKIYLFSKLPIMCNSGF